MTHYLNIASINFNCDVLGPGTRAVVWLQGCKLNCPGCINKHLQSLEINQLVSPRDLAEDILLNSENLEGLTITGGEPFLQPEPLSLLVELIRQRSSLSLMIYTGFYLEELKKSNCKAICSILANIDVLIDGRYHQEESTEVSFKGSKNQTTYFFTDLYHADDFRQKNSFEVGFKNNRLRMVGFYDEDKFR